MKCTVWYVQLSVYINIKVISLCFQWGQSSQTYAVWEEDQNCQKRREYALCSSTGWRVGLDGCSPLLSGVSSTAVCFSFAATHLSTKWWSLILSRSLIYNDLYHSNAYSVNSRCLLFTRWTCWWWERWRLLGSSSWRCKTISGARPRASAGSAPSCPAWDSQEVDLLSL